MNAYLDRRHFVKLGIASAGLLSSFNSFGEGITGVAAYPVSRPRHAPVEEVKIGFVGVGNMGSAHVKNLLNIENARLCAVCDIVPEKVERVKQWVVDAGFPEPAGYSKGKHDFERMCENEDLDIVYTATPWEWHVPVCVAAMKNGKHAATEVPAAVTLEECWLLVETAEKFNRYCVMLENCCYDRMELMILNMVRKGVLGDLVHAECGYMHDIRVQKVLPQGQENWWRTYHSINRKGNLYPTHGLGPVAQDMNINRGDQFDYLVSMSSMAVGLNHYAREKFGKDHPLATQAFANGDVNTSIIKTKKGRTILIQHDCNLPRPYSREIVVQGTKGIVRKYPEEKVYIEGVSPEHEWEDVAKYYEQYEHPLWSGMQAKFEGAAGHGGMDYLEDYRLIQAIHKGIEPDMDVYDAASWSSISGVSAESVKNKGVPVDIPDFTRGAWKTREPLGIVEVA